MVGQDEAGRGGLRVLPAAVLQRPQLAGVGRDVRVEPAHRRPVHPRPDGQRVVELGGGPRVLAAGEQGERLELVDEWVAGHALEGLVGQIQRGGVVARLERVAGPVKRLVPPFPPAAEPVAVFVPSGSGLDVWSPCSAAAPSCWLSDLVSWAASVREEWLSVDDASEDVLAYASPEPVP